MSWRDDGTIVGESDLYGAGMLQHRRDVHETGDTFYSVWFYPRTAVLGEEYSPLPFYHVAWARVPAGNESRAIRVTIHHDVAVVLGMGKQEDGLPQVSVQRVEHITPILEILGRGFAAGFNARRPRAT